jgi:hemerythrin
MLLRWDEKCRVGNDQIDQEHQDLFQLINEFYDAFAEKRERTLALHLLSRLADHLINEDTLLGAPLQNKKNDDARSPQPA